jgi:hypothetical protein
MVHDQAFVRRQPDVDLDAVRSDVTCAAHRGDGVLGSVDVVATVRKD